MATDTPSAATVRNAPTTANTGIRWAGFALGFALGGFADGILFHQVLQWHHLMSLVDLPIFSTLEGQVWADGLFHVATYIIAMAGLYLLWRNRRAACEPPAGRDLIATFLIGFGVWHIADNILIHWTLEWHHIRLPPSNPLLWDMVTFVVGFAFVAWGWIVWRSPPSSGPGRMRGAGPGLLAWTIVIAGPIAALPPPTSATMPALMAVRFATETSRDDAFLTLIALGGRVVSEEPTTRTWIVELDASPDTRQLATSGASLLANVPLPAGCFGAWRARTAIGS